VASQGHDLSVLDVSHVSDGFLRLRPCGFVSPHCRVQGSSLQGLVPHAQLEKSRRLLVALSLFSDANLPTVTHQRQSMSPHPQGLAPCMKPLPSRQGLAIARARSPPGLALLQVLSLIVVGMPSHPLTLMALRKRRHCRLFRRLQRFNRRSTRLVSPETADLLEVSGLSN